MDTYNSLEKNWIASFESADTDRIIKALYEVRNSGSVKILPVLLRLVNNQTDPIITDEIIRLVSELKTVDSVPVIARSIKENDFGTYQSSIIAACWQSGLDFSGYLRIFAEQFIKSDYSTALEAFTVIEESLGNATTDEISACNRFLNESKNLVTDEKLPLFIELQKVVKSA